MNKIKEVFRLWLETTKKTWKLSKEIDSRMMWFKVLDVAFGIVTPILFLTVSQPATKFIENQLKNSITIEKYKWFIIGAGFLWVISIYLKPYVEKFLIPFKKKHEFKYSVFLMGLLKFIPHDYEINKEKRLQYRRGEKMITEIFTACAEQLEVITEIITLIVGCAVAFQLNKTAMVSMFIIGCIGAYFKFRKEESIFEHEYAEKNQFIQQRFNSVKNEIDFPENLGHRMTHSLQKMYLYYKDLFWKNANREMFREFTRLKTKRITNILTKALPACVIATLYVMALGTSDLSIMTSFVIMSMAMTKMLQFISHIQRQTFVARTLNDALYIIELARTIESEESKKIIFNDEITSIHFENITYTYPEREFPVLENFNLELTFPRWYRIDGENGTGKSTLIKLLLGILTPQKGTVYINEIDIRNINQESLLTAVAVNNTLVNFVHGITIFQNITNDSFIKKDMIKQELLVTKLIEEVGLPEVVHQNNGIHSFSGSWFEGGISLSSGQEQRLLIAKLLFQSQAAVFMVADEIFANIDTQSHGKLFKIMKSYSPSGIIVAHSLSLFDGAFKITLPKLLYPYHEDSENDDMEDDFDDEDEDEENGWY